MGEGGGVVERVVWNMWYWLVVMAEMEGENGNFAWDFDGVVDNERVQQQQAVWIKDVSREKR